MKTVVTFGTFDLFHVGHLNILRRAAQLGDRLVVGISSDAFSESKKSRKPIFDQDSRQRIIRSLRWVDDTFIEESLEQKRDYLIEHSADILVMGDDWKGKFDHLSDICAVIYLPRTTGVSTTEILETIKDLKY